MRNAMDTTNPTATIKCWVELYSDSMYSWSLHKTSSRETAEDLVQETFLAAVQSFEKFKGDSNPKTWLFSILNNKINDYYRSSFRKVTTNDTTIFETFFDSEGQWKKEERPKQWNGEPENILDDAEFNKVLQHCMEKLPASWFSAVQLKYMEAKKGEIICQELQITPTNFWQILHRAKLQLRKCLELNWFKD